MSGRNSEAPNLASVCTPKNGHAEVDGCGIHSIEPSVEFKLLGDSPLLGQRYQVESKLLENPGLAEHVCLRECVPDDGLVPKSKLVAALFMCFCNIGKFAKASASNKLSENKDQQMVPMGEALVPSSVVILGDDSPEPPLGQEHRNLRENVLSVVHLCSILMTEKRKRISRPGQYLITIRNCA